VQIIFNLAMTCSIVVGFMVILDYAFNLSGVHSAVGDKYSVWGSIFVILAVLFWFICIIMVVWSL